MVSIQADSKSYHINQNGSENAIESQGAPLNPAITDIEIVAISVHDARSAPCANADDFFRTLLHVYVFRPIVNLLE